jgi:hypothetical protein
MFDLRYQMTLFDFFGLYFNQGGLAQGPMATYMEAMSYLELINDVFNYPYSFTYTNTTQRLFLETQQSLIPAGSYLMVEAYVKVNPEYHPTVWSDRIFQRHYGALLKKQWAQNLMKFAGVPLPGGAQLNAAAMMVRNKNIYDAAAIIDNCAKKGGKIVNSVLNAARINGIKKGYAEERMWVKEVILGKKLGGKKMDIRARGKFGIIHAPISHITIILEEKSPVDFYKKMISGNAP